MTATPRTGAHKRPQSRQSTLATFFTPTAVKKTNVPQIESRYRAESPLKLEDSDDDDDLLAMDSILHKTAAKAPTASTPTTRSIQTIKRQREEDPETLLYKGKFDIASLLANRTQRNDQKERMARLDCDLDGRVLPKQVRPASVKDSRIQDLLKNTTNGKADKCWQAFGDAIQVEMTDDQFEYIQDSFDGLNNLDSMILTRRLKLALRRGQYREPQLSTVLIYRLSAAKSINFVTRCMQAIQELPELNIDDDCFKCTFRSLGLRSRTRNYSSPDRPPYDPLLLLKLESLLNLIARNTVSTASLLLDILIIALDSTYGPLLTIPLDAVLLTRPSLTHIDILEISESRETQSSVLRILMDADLAKSVLTTESLGILITSIRIRAETNYRDLITTMDILDLATSNSSDHSHLAPLLLDLHGRIIDSKAAFIERSELKARIQRLSDRLKYSSSTRRDVFRYNH